MSNKKCLILLCVFLLFACSGPSTVNITGNGSGTGVGNPVVLGTVVYPVTKKRAENISVKIRRTSFIKDNTHSNSIVTQKDAFTDKNGQFKIDSLDTGSYTIEFCDSTFYSSLFRFAITSDRDTVVETNVTLMHSSKVSGYVRTVNGERVGSNIYVYGLDRKTTPDDSGRFTIILPPSARYTLLIAPVNSGLKTHEIEIDEMIEDDSIEIGETECDEFEDH